MIEPLGDTRLTNSRLRSAKTCLRKHWLQYELGLRPQETAQALRMGSAFHLGQELFDDPEYTDTQAILTAVADYDAGCPDYIDEDDWWVEREKVARLLSAHLWRWGDMNDGIEVLATEGSFEIPVRNPETGYPSQTWTLAGKRDKIVRLPDGRTAIMEYKTTSGDISPDSDYWKRLEMDAQISLYWLAAEEDGIDVDTVLYDVTKKPTIRPKTVYERDENGDKIVLDENGERVIKKNGEPRQSGSKKKGYTPIKRKETPEEYGDRLTKDIGDRPDYYFARREIPRLDVDLTEGQADLWVYGKLIRECQKRDSWPRNTGSCFQFGRCRCWELCSQGWQPEDGIPEGWMRVDDPHQELIDD